MKKINPKIKKDKDEEHILITTSKDTVAIRLRKGDESYQLIYVTKAEMAEIIKAYEKMK